MTNDCFVHDTYTLRLASAMNDVVVLVAVAVTGVKAVALAAVVVAAAADVGVKKVAAATPAPTTRRAAPDAMATAFTEEVRVSSSETETSGLLIISCVVVKLRMKGKVA